MSALEHSLVMIAICTRRSIRMCVTAICVEHKNLDVLSHLI